MIDSFHPGASEWSAAGGHAASAVLLRPIGDGPAAGAGAKLGEAAAWLGSGGGKGRSDEAARLHGLLLGLRLALAVFRTPEAAAKARLVCETDSVAAVKLLRGEWAVSRGGGGGGGPALPAAVAAAEAAAIAALRAACASLAARFAGVGFGHVPRTDNAPALALAQQAAGACAAPLNALNPPTSRSGLASLDASISSH